MNICPEKPFVFSVSLVVVITYYTKRFLGSIFVIFLTRTKLIYSNAKCVFKGNLE